MIFSTTFSKLSSSSSKKKVMMLALLLVVLMIPITLSIMQQKTNIQNFAASNCQPDANMVNPCRPWVGASAFGNPGIPGKSIPQDVVAQFNYLEQLIDRPLDIFRDYHCAYGSGQCTDGEVPLSSVDIKYATRANTYINVNWIPSPDWTIYPVSVNSTGASQIVYKQIVHAAKTIKSIAPHPVFLSLWHEGNLHVTDGEPGCPKGSGKTRLGTAAQSITAWQNVHDIFKQQGVTNVIWVMNYASDPAPIPRCLVTRMWPGDQYVNWVTWDTYSRGKTWDQTSGDFYNFLLKNTNSSSHPVVNAKNQPVDFTQMPWGVGEFGTCKQPTTGVSPAQYFQSVKTALDSNAYPRLKMYMLYANTAGGSGTGCLTDYDTNGTYDSVKQTAVNALFHDPLLLGNVSTSPSPSNPPTKPPTNCQPDDKLVNPCRPLVGAAASGNPGIPGQTKPGADKISQFDYLEQLINHPLDVFRSYDGANIPPLTNDEMHFAKRSNTYVDINWKPVGKWASANGSDATVNAIIDKAAASIKSIAPHKVFLTVWHEPQNDVSAWDPGADGAAEQAACKNDPKFYKLTGHAGTPAEYKAMWQNVENRFKADGATNVVWVMNYMSDPVLGCLVKPLWPGSNLIDWVEYDTYDRNNNANNTWDTTVGAFYNFLQNIGKNNPSSGILSKPWGLGEFGTCKNSNAANAQQYYIDGKNAYLANKYPKLKMYLIYADTGNSSGYGCLTDYDANTTNPASNNGTYDPKKQQDVNQFFDAIFSSQPSITPTISPSTSPTPVKGETTFSLTLCPHQQGDCGDNRNPHSKGNHNPHHATRPITLTFFKSGDTPVATANGSASYSSSGNNFQGKATGNITSGSYIIKVRMDGYLTRQLPGIFTITKGHAVTLPEVSLVTGDITNDNRLNILDYNALTSCFDAKASSSGCLAPITNQYQGADINDDGAIDGVDYNTFIRELAVQEGDGGGGGQ